MIDREPMKIREEDAFERMFAQRDCSDIDGLRLFARGLLMDERLGRRQEG